MKILDLSHFARFHNRLVKGDIRMNKSIFIMPLAVMFCFVFCGCENSSRHGLDSTSSSGRTLTLSQQQLVSLDWHSPNLNRGRVMKKRVVSGQGVEFDIYFPGSTPDTLSIQYVSSGEGGTGKLVGSDVKDYDKYALSFTLVSINGQTEPNEKEKVEVGSLIGPTAAGDLSDYTPVTISLLSSEKSKVAATPMRTSKIYQIGFYVRLLKPQNWNPAGTEIVLRIDPAEDAGFVH
jgi:hypothetical protein